jgi:hypothetical protein
MFNLDRTVFKGFGERVKEAAVASPAVQKKAVSRLALFLQSRGAKLPNPFKAPKPKPKPVPVRS